ncbi:MAG: hypothetical protein H6550_16025 [Chitinophagales bacterium]|nr:hypothetical protein [Chitinophagales bacterium]
MKQRKPLSGRKISSFAAAMSGDKNAVVVDIWLLRAFDMHRKFQTKTKLTDMPVDLFGNTDGYALGKLRNSGATDRQYSMIEDWVRVVAACMQVESRQLSAMIWAGVRIAHNGDTETHYKERLQHYMQNLFSV